MVSKKGGHKTETHFDYCCYTSHKNDEIICFVINLFFLNRCCDYQRQSFPSIIMEVSDLKSEAQRLTRNYRAAKLIMNETYETPSAELFKNLKWMTLEQRFEFNRVVMMYKCLHNLAPSYLQTDLINPREIHDHFTRQNN